MSTMTDKLVTRWKEAAFTASTLDAYRAEVKKDGEVGTKWLEAFEHRVVGAVKAEATKLKKTAPGWQGPELDGAVKNVLKSIEAFCKTGDPKEAHFSYPISYVLDELDDPERYADGEPRGDTPLTPLIVMLRKEESLADKFGQKFFEKYSLRARSEMQRSLPEADAEVFTKAFKVFMGDLFEKPFKQLMTTFERELGKGKKTAGAQAEVEREAAYFHVGNGGLKLYLNEVYSAGYGSTFKVRYEMSSFGAQAAGEFDLPASTAEWMIVALTKLMPTIAASERGRSYTPYEDSPVLYTDGRQTSADPVMMEADSQSAQMSPTASRLAARMMAKQAFTFPSPKALMNYLREHPKADKSKHEVAEKGEKASPPKDEPKGDKGHKDDHDEGHDDHDEKPKKKGEPDFSPLSRKLAEKVQGWGAKAVKTLADAPKDVQKFVEDDVHRRKTLMAAHKKVEHFFKLPEALIDTAREEIHEFKDAGSALAKAVKGQKLSKHDKHALKTVGTHLAVTAVATALTATSFGAGAALFGKAMAKHVALKAVSGVLAKAHMLEELGHIGHGIQHVMDKMAADVPSAKGEKGTGEHPMTGYAKLVLGAVAKEMEGLNDVKTIGEALDSFSGDGSDIKPMPGKGKKAMVDRLIERSLV